LEMVKCFREKKVFFFEVDPQGDPYPKPCAHNTLRRYRDSRFP